MLSIAVAIGGMAGCRSVATSAQPATDASQQTERLRADLREYRESAWKTALQVAAVYDTVPAQQCPGLAAFVQDLRRLQRRVETGDQLRLDQIDIAALVTANPHFWRASLEISPSDGSLLLLHGTLLAAAGDIWKANRVITATTQILPMDTQVRALFLAHSYGLAALILQAQELASAQLRGVRADRLEARTQTALQAWPENAVLLADSIDQRARLQPLQARHRAGMAGNDDRATGLYGQEIDRLAALDPVGAAPYRGGPLQREQGARLKALWTRMAAKDAMLDPKEIGELVTGLEVIGAADLALMVQRLQIATRGFAAPADAAGYRRMLPRLIGPGPADDILSALDRGEINVVELTGGRDAFEWRGDPAANPLLAQQIEREIADCTFQIALLRGNPAAQAVAYRRRGVQQSRAGMYEEALVDFDIAIRLGGRQPTLLADQAAIFGTLRRDAEAEALFAELERSDEGRGTARHSLGVFRFGQGRFDEARAALEEEVRRSQSANGYAAILAELAARRGGGSDRAMLDRVRRRTADDAWARKCLDYLAGDCTEEQLLESVQGGGEVVMAEKMCEASFIVAQVALASGDQAKGLDFLEDCIQTGMTGFAEFTLARLELRRLAPEREAKFRPTEDGSSRPAEPPAGLPGREKNSPAAGGGSGALPS
jgi:lipoprotein NlpI